MSYITDLRVDQIKSKLTFLKGFVVTVEKTIEDIEFLLNNIDKEITKK